jgi:ABC-type branched-subunit amino acid transport system permease subunit
MTLAFSLLLLQFIETLDIAGRTIGISSAFHFGAVEIGSVRWDLDSRDGGFLLFVTSIATVSLLFAHRLLKTGVGRAMTAIRDDEVLAASVGIQPVTYRLTAFALSAVVAGIAGICFAAQLRYITPGFFDFNLIIVLIVQLVIGGRGFVFGPVVGAAIYVTFTEWIQIGDAYQSGFFGVILIAIVLLAPRGVLGTAAYLIRRRTGGRPRPDGDLRPERREAQTV